jgi:glutamate dehydrogenase
MQPATLSPRTLRTLWQHDAASQPLPALNDSLWPWLSQTLGAGQLAVTGWSNPQSTCSWWLVQTPDQPFLTDTLVQAVRQAGHEPLGLWHPVVQVARDAKQRLLSAKIAKRTATEQTHEAWWLVQLPVLTPTQQAQLEHTLQQALAQAQAVVKDFPAMRALLQSMVKHTDEPEDAKLLGWLADGGLVLLGAQHGISKLGLAHTLALPAAKTVAGLHLMRLPTLSPVHRASPLLAVQAGPITVVGLLASTAYTHSVTVIPALRRTVQQVLRASGWPHGSQRHRSLTNVLATWPREELFLTPPAELLSLTQQAVAVREKPDVCVLLRLTPGLSGAQGLASVLIYLPLARMRTRVREAIQAALQTALGGTLVEYRVELGGESGHELARLRFVITWDGRSFTPEALTTTVRNVVRGWEDELAEALTQTHGLQAARLAQTAAQLGGPVYVAGTTVAYAVQDVAFWQSTAALAVRVQAGVGSLQLRVLQRGAAVPLATLLPLVDSCGLTLLDVQHMVLDTTHVQALQCAPVAAPVTTEAAATTHWANLANVIHAGLTGGVEVDSLNRLALLAGATPFILAQWRAWVAYLAQVTNQLAPRLDGRTLRYAIWAQPTLAQALWQLFAAQHQPGLSARSRQQGAQAARSKLQAGLPALPTAADERVWQLLVSLVEATLRSNAWAVRPGEALAFKISSEALGLPTPRPWREIFVHHPQVEGVHLRGGPVSRGGLRHSDRAQDYRTEVLGLMLAQMRKNTIIVPVGAKGGFFIRTPLPAGGPARVAGIEDAYARYIRALLSVTDTYAADGHVVPPTGVVCLDAPDPYLVVAADKGTATFSDLANRTAQAADYWEGLPIGYWLGDAFASGGSQGYDHKALAITAKGALISVRGHLQRLGRVPTAANPLTVVAIGDMGGDVCGNGLLEICRMISPHVRVVVAFDHAQIFLDPAADTTTSLTERARLFKARQDWSHYDASKLSKGGAVFARSAKQLTPSPAARAALGLKGSGALTPEQLIQAILKAPVDVIWNGGIGTYIKSSEETHADVHDKANDAVRVDAKHVRAKVIGEGGNLGLTPKGRVQLAQCGVQLNTDALDNSAGVDTSDHEVNLKIAFTPALHNGSLSMAARNQLIANLAPAMVPLVLADNIAQNHVVDALARLPEEDHLALHAWQTELVRQGWADDALDCLPTLKDLQARKSYTRPELCALLAASKAWLRHTLDATPLPELPLYDDVLLQAFPAPLRASHGPLLRQHALRKAVVACGLTNQLLNRLGLLLIPQLMADQHVTAAQAVEAVLVALELLEGWRLWAELDAAELAPPVLQQAQARLQAVVLVLARGLLQQGQQWPLAKSATWLAPVVALRPSLSELARPEAAVWEKSWAQQGCPPTLAKALSLLSVQVLWLDALLLHQQGAGPLPQVLRRLLRVGEAAKLPALVHKLQQVPQPDAWQRQAVQALLRDVFDLQQQLVAQGVATPEGALPEGHLVKRWATLRDGLLRNPHPTLSQSMVVLAALRSVAQTPKNQV